MNFCSNCGNKLNTSTTHCGYCGKSLGNISTNPNTSNNTNYLNNSSNNIIGNYYDDKLYIRMSESKKYARISLILALIPVILIVFCYIKSLGSFDESGAGAIWWIVILYFMTVGIPVAIASIIMGIGVFYTRKMRWQ